MADWQVVEGGVTAPKGFIAAGIVAGLKSTGAKDLALILSQSDAIAPGYLPLHRCVLPALIIVVSVFN